MLKFICFQDGAEIVIWIKGITVMSLKFAPVIRTYNVKYIMLFESDLNFTKSYILGVDGQKERKVQEFYQRNNMAKV